MTSAAEAAETSVVDDAAPVEEAAPTATTMIEVRNLRKFYGRFEALKDISFAVGKGEIVGLLGPNGAGKTTTMKILTGYISATSGSFSVAGFDGFDQSLEVRRRVGYLPENAPIYPDMGIVEYLSFVCELRRIRRKARRARIARIVEQVGLGPMILKNIGELSKGYRQRVGLAQALIHEPPVLILDEPTSGLDPNQIVEIRSLIKELGQERTIILSTHNLPEVQATCSRMIIISNGVKVADGTAKSLEAEGQEHNLYRVSARLPDELSPEAARTTLAGLDGVTTATHVGPTGDGGHRFSVDSTGGDLAPDLFRHATEAGWVLTELRRDIVDLEKLFHRLTQY